MNTDDYIKVIEKDVHLIHRRIDKIDVRLYSLEKKQYVDDSIKSFFTKNWWNLISLGIGLFNLITLWADLYYTYKVWVPKH
jgi:hypothetical protein